MRVRLKLKPGQRGTKKLVGQYGDRLLCVRYRYDEKTRKRFTTVELIVSESKWVPAGPKPETIVPVKIEYYETDLRTKVKNAGGRWSKSRKLWRLPYETVCRMGLKERMVKDKENGEKEEE